MVEFVAYKIMLIYNNKILVVVLSWFVEKVKYKCFDSKQGLLINAVGMKWRIRYQNINPRLIGR
jgi:hypothetical protein